MKHSKIADMPKARKTEPHVSPWDAEVQLLLWLATCVSVFSFLFFFQRGEVLLYGDAIAHMNIARRVFDSKTPGLLQLGTVWLPLPHLLMIPFLLSKEMWQRGVGGSFPSMAAYILGVIGVFRLVRGLFARNGELDTPGRSAAWIAAFGYAANPNLIYMQSTAMGEALYLALFIWAVVYFCEAMRGDNGSLTKCGLTLAAACLTRYDGWFLASGMAVLAILMLFEAKNPVFSRAAVARFVLISAAAPALWLAYNGIVYRNPLEFENGPYSAKAIERRTQTGGNPGHPGSGRLVASAQYFLKSAEFNMAQNLWLQRGWILLVLLALLTLLAAHQLGDSFFLNVPLASGLLPFLLLLIPLPFYALSVAYGGVPIFIPAWWPFTHYNARYGLQLLPAFSFALALITYFVLGSRRFGGKVRSGVALALLAFLIGSYSSAWQATPICLTEAEVNMRTRNRLEAELATWLRKLPANATLLMYLGDHVGAVQLAGIPLKDVINEGNHRTWMQPSDPQGLWEHALADPAQFADYAVAFEGDPVWLAIKDRHLRALVELHVSGQARAILYRLR